MDVCRICLDINSNGQKRNYRKQVRVLSSDGEDGKISGRMKQENFRKQEAVH